MVLAWQCGRGGEMRVVVGRLVVILQAGGSRAIAAGDRPRATATAGSCAVAECHALPRPPSFVYHLIYSASAPGVPASSVLTAMLLSLTRVVAALVLSPAIVRATAVRRASVCNGHSEACRLHIVLPHTAHFIL